MQQKTIRTYKNNNNNNNNNNDDNDKKKDFIIIFNIRILWRKEDH